MGLGLLVAVLVGMLVHYGAVAAADGHATTQTAERFIQSPEGHVGEQLYFWGTVTETTRDSFTVRVDDQVVRITGQQETVQPGDLVQIVGPLQRNGAVDAERIVISPGANLKRLYVVSGFGLLVALGTFGRSWTIRWHSLLFVTRSDDDG